MADSVITLKDQKFRKVKGVWVDQKKTPAPKDLIALLDKLSAAEAAVAGPESAKEDKPALPVLPIAAKDFSTAKLESSINRLAKIIEKLSKTIEKGVKSPSGTDAKDTSSSQRVYEPGKIPTLREAMKLNRQEFFKGTTNKYGEVEQRGLLRDLGSILPWKANKYRAQDRQRAAIGSELREYEGTLQSNPNLSKKQINEKIAEKRKELENPKAVPAKPEQAAERITKDTAKQVAQMKVANPELTSSKALEQIRYKPAMPEAISAGEKERGKTLVQGKSEFASPDVDKKIIAVKITEIDDSVLKKLSEIFGKKADDTKPSEDKEEDKPKTADNKGGGLRDKIKKIRDMFKRKSPKGAAAAVEKEAEQLLDKNGKPLRGAAKASREAKLAKEAAQGAEQVAKKPSILSRILGGGTKTAGVEGAEQVAKKPSILSRILGGGSKAAETGVEAGVEGIASTGAKPGIMSKIFGGGSKAAETGVEAGVEGIASTGAKPGIMSKIFGGAGKEGVKLVEKEGVKTAEKVGAKSLAKVGLKALGKSALKKIPLLGLAAGGVFAAQRALKGDFLGAAGELASGAAGTIPGIGTAASIGIDAALAAKDMGAFGGATPESPTEAAQKAPAEAVKPKTPSKFASVAKALGKGALMATPFGAAALGAKAIGGLLKNNKNTAEMAKPTGVTEQTQALTVTTKQVEAAKQQKPTAGPTVINNNVSSPTNVSSSQGVIGGPTVADRGSLNLASF